MYTISSAAELGELSIPFVHSQSAATDTSRWLQFIATAVACVGARQETRRWRFHFAVVPFRRLIPPLAVGSYPPLAA